jgi:hypothetical protein
MKRSACLLDASENPNRFNPVGATRIDASASGGMEWASQRGAVDD